MTSGKAAHCRRGDHFIRSRADAKTFVHPCGSVLPIILGLTEIAVQRTNPMQRDAAEADTATLKKEFRKGIRFRAGGLTHGESSLSLL
jgi:hypothetical protein